MALLISIEASCFQMDSASCSKLVNSENKELKRIVLYLSNDSKSGSSSLRQSYGHGFFFFFFADSFQTLNYSLGM
jgi:hypothetical protein